MLGVLDLHFHQRHPEKILFQGPGFYFWVTTDFGKTFTAHSTPGDTTLGFWMELKVHPNVPDWLLAKVKRKDCIRDLSSAACAHDLFVSQVIRACHRTHVVQQCPTLPSIKSFAWILPSSRHDQNTLLVEAYFQSSQSICQQVTDCTASCCETGWLLSSLGQPFKQQSYRCKEGPYKTHLCKQLC